MLKLMISSILICSGFALAAPVADHVMFTPKELKWSAGPKALPAGAEVVVLYGNPMAAGPFGMRLKMPAKYFIPPHFHPEDENVTVISGTFLMGLGNDAKASTMSLPPGSFAQMKVGTHHFARTTEETIVQINGTGPWGITYLNPSDDPRK